METGLLFPSYILCHGNRTTVPILYSLSWKQDYCSHPMKMGFCSHPIFSVMKTGLLFPSYILWHGNRTIVPILWKWDFVPILYSLSWKQDYCSHPIFSDMKTGLLCPSYILCHQSWKEDYKFPSYILCHENRTLKRSTVMFYALLRNVSHAKTEKTEFNNCLSVCHGMSVFACIDTCINTCIVSASLTQVFFLFSFFPKRFPMEFSQSNWDTLKQRYSIQSFLSCTLIPKQFPSRQQLLLFSATFFSWLPTAVGS